MLLIFQEPLIIASRQEDELCVTVLGELLRKDYHSNEHDRQFNCSVEPIAASNGAISQTIANDNTKHTEANQFSKSRFFSIAVYFLNHPKALCSVSS